MGGIPDGSYDDPRFRQDGNAFNSAWYYNWQYDPAPYAWFWMEYVPMVWCRCSSANTYCPDDNPSNASENEIDSIAYAIQQIGTDYDGYLLYVNEPNNASAGQCGAIIGGGSGNNYDRELAIATAADIYAQLRVGLPNAKLIGPQMAEGANPEGWLLDWIAAVNDLGVPLPDGYGVHAYALSPAEDETDILGPLNNFYIALNVTDPGKELWLTEFGFDRIPYSTARDDRVVGELEDLIDALETATYDYVTRYAYYVTRHSFTGILDPHWPEDTDLWNRDAFTLSPLGERYQSLTTGNDN